jgi:hypothetical protein
VAEGAVVQVLQVEVFREQVLMRGLEVPEHLHQLQVHLYIMLEVVVEE